MITLSQVSAAIREFESTSLPPLSSAWDKLRRAALDAIAQYAAENELDGQGVIDAVREASLLRGGNKRESVSGSLISP